MTTLIVGCGYLGTRVARLLRSQGEAVIGTTRSPARLGELEALGIAPRQADLLDPSLPPWPPCDRLLICVAPGRGDGQSAWAVYVDGVRAVLDRLPAVPPRIVLVSSTGVHAQGDGSWVDEESPADPLTESGRANREAERILHDRAAAAGLSAAVIRLAGLYGPGRILRREALRRGEPIPADPEHWLNLIHIDDAARLAAALLTRGDAPRSLYLASDGRPVLRREFYQAAARLLAAPPPRFTPVPPAGRDTTNKRVDSRRIRRELGLECLYPDFEAGLAASLEDPPARLGGMS